MLSGSSCQLFIEALLEQERNQHIQHALVKITLHFASGATQTGLTFT